MGDCIIDTNVLLVASAHHPESTFKDSALPEVQMQIVLDWLMAFRRDGQSKVVFDRSWKIWEEYHHKMTGQDIGLMVVTEKLQSSALRDVEIAFDPHGHGRLPRELEAVVHDRSDRKFVAVALADRANGERSKIVNAVDSDWCQWQPALEQAGIVIEHLIDGLCDDQRPSATKRPGKAKG